MKLRSLLLAAAAILALTVPAQAIDCNFSAQYDTNTNGATRIVVGVAAQRIFVCGYTIVSGGTVSFGLVSGTGTNCATNQTNVTPQYALVAQSSVSDSSPVYRGLVVEAARDLCVKASAGVAVSAVVFYRLQ